MFDSKDLNMSWLDLQQPADGKTPSQERGKQL